MRVDTVEYLVRIKKIISHIAGAAPYLITCWLSQV